MAEWQPIETAPKGGGAERVTDPKWVEPPRILLYADGEIVVARWEHYYAEGGGGFDGRENAWVFVGSGERLADYYNDPTHWMPLPEPPNG